MVAIVQVLHMSFDGEDLSERYAQLNNELRRIQMEEGEDEGNLRVLAIQQLNDREWLVTVRRRVSGDENDVEVNNEVEDEDNDSTSVGDD